MKRLFASLTMGAILVPQLAIAQQPCVLSAQETVAGLGTEITASGCVPGLLDITILSPDGTERQLAMNVTQGGQGRLPVQGSFTQVAGSYAVRSPAGSTSFTVLPDVPDARFSELTASAPSLLPGDDGVTVTLALRDRFGNPLAGRPVALFSARDRDTVTARGRETDTHGRMTWTVSTDQPGPLTLTAYDILSTLPVAQRLTLNAGQSTTSFAPSPFTAALTGSERGGVFGAIDRFEVRISGGGTVRANNDLTMIVTALDAAGNVVEDYVGDILLTSSDGNAVLPSGGMTRFQQYELGVKNIQLGLRFRTPGQQTITVRDAANAAVTGSATVTVETSGGSAGGDIVILDPPNRAFIGDTSILLQGRAPSFVNLRVKGGAQDVTGASDAEGVFRITVPLNPTQRDHTLFVVSDNGRYESAAHTLILDNEGPVIDAVSFEPTRGTAGEKAVMTVRTEPGLRTVSATIGSTPVTLTEAGSGTYRVEFTAPAAGTLPVKVTATDAADNEGTMMAQWDVEGSGIPQVQNVTAEGRANAVFVAWQPVDGDIAQYRIYVGTSPTDYAYGLETGQPVSSALVNGLEPGRTYFIAITALDAEGNESERSAPASASPIGMRLTATPGNESLQLTWQPPAGTPLNSYILEYGVEAGTYTEKRTISGELRTYVLRDLLNDVTYEARLTPVTVTGQRIDELAGIVRGAPNGSGFHHGAQDPVPFIDDEPLHGGAPILNPGNVPRNTESGLPSFAVWGLVAFIFCGGMFFMMKRRQRILTAQFLQTMDQQYRGRQ